MAKADKKISIKWHIDPQKRRKHNICVAKSRAKHKSILRATMADINLYLERLKRPLMDFGKPKKPHVLKGKFRPNYDPPDEVMAKMDCEQLRAWRKNERLKRKARVSRVTRENEKKHQEYLCDLLEELKKEWEQTENEQKRKSPISEVVTAKPGCHTIGAVNERSSAASNKTFAMEKHVSPKEKKDPYEPKTVTDAKSPATSINTDKNLTNKRKKSPSGNVVTDNEEARKDPVKKHRFSSEQSIATPNTTCYQSWLKAAMNASSVSKAPSTRTLEEVNAALNILAMAEVKESKPGNTAAQARPSKHMLYEWRTLSPLKRRENVRRSIQDMLRERGIL